MLNIEVRVRKNDASLLEGVRRYLAQLMQEQFYGTIEIQFMNGEIVVVRKQETFKPAAFLVVE